MIYLHTFGKFPSEHRSRTSPACLCRARLVSPAGRCPPAGTRQDTTADIPPRSRSCCLHRYQSLFYPDFIIELKLLQLSHRFPHSRRSRRADISSQSCQNTTWVFCPDTAPGPAAGDTSPGSRLRPCSCSHTQSG